MNKIPTLLLTACMLSLRFVPAQAAEEAAPIMVPTAAVLPFEARGRQAENDQAGKSVSDLLFVTLLENGAANLVERAELDKALNELHLSAVGLVAPESQLQLGRLIGAKILISGSLFETGGKKYVVAKVIGTETSRVLGCSVNGRGDYVDLAPELAAKVTKVLEKDVDKLLPAKMTARSALDKLSEVQGNRRPVYLSISEDIQVSAPDPASEIELKKLLLGLGFEVVGSRSEAAFALICEAVASNAGQYQKFSSASARVELSIYSGKDNQLLASGSAKETVASATYIIAAKDAIAQATLRLAGQLLTCMR